MQLDLSIIIFTYFLSRLLHSHWHSQPYLKMKSPTKYDTGWFDALVTKEERNDRHRKLALGEKNVRFMKWWTERQSDHLFYWRNNFWREISWEAKMVSHVRLENQQNYRQQVCLSCMTGLYGCRWKRYRRSTEPTTVVSIFILVFFDRFLLFYKLNMLPSCFSNFESIYWKLQE